MVANRPQVCGRDRRYIRARDRRRHRAAEPVAPHLDAVMVRKITPTSGGWRKSFGSSDQQRAFELSATRTLLAFSPTAAAWRERAIQALSAPFIRRLHAPALIAAFRTFAEAVVACEVPVLPGATTSPHEPLAA